MNDQENILPEKCCAKCGFLYFLSNDAKFKEDEIFDPDFLRTLSIPPNITNENWNEHLLTSKRYHFSSSNTFQFFKWPQVSGVYCLQLRFNSLDLRNDGRHAVKAEQTIPTINKALNEIFSNDRTDCQDFFPYHSGFSPREHADIRLQQKREQEQQEFQERQNKLFLQLETTAAERDLFWKQKVEKADQKEDKDRSLDRWITIIFALLATIISFINLIIASRNLNP